MLKERSDQLEAVNKQLTERAATMSEKLRTSEGSSNEAQRVCPSIILLWSRTSLEYLPLCFLPFAATR
jgi:hypothetical protein